MKFAQICSVLVKLIGEKSLKSRVDHTAAKFDVEFKQLRSLLPRIADGMQLWIEMQSGDKHDIEEPNAEVCSVPTAWSRRGLRIFSMDG